MILIKKLLDISENLLVSFKGLLILGNDFVIPMDNDATQMDDDATLPKLRIMWYGSYHMKFMLSVNQ